MIRIKPTTLVCRHCRKEIPDGESVVVHVGFFGNRAITVEEEKRHERERQEWWEQASEEAKEGVAKLRALAGMFRMRRGWTYGLSCLPCIEKRYLDEQAKTKERRISWGEDMSDFEPVPFKEEMERYWHHECLGCGRHIYRKWDYRQPFQYCGEECRTIHRRKERQATAKTHTNTCQVCGDPFTSKRNDAKFCSPRCRKAASRGKSGART